ncbi:hypothetical protein VPH35_096228 [Triticum aestivum]
MNWKRLSSRSSSSSSIPRPLASIRRAKTSRNSAIVVSVALAYRLELGRPTTSPSRGLLLHGSRISSMSAMRPATSSRPRAVPAMATLRLSATPSSTTVLTTPPTCQSNQMLESRS